MRRKPKQKRSIILKLLILLFCGYAVFSLSNLWATLDKSQAELERLQLIKQNEQRTVDELKEILKDKTNKQIIEKAARERLGYIYSDEQIFIDISGN